MVRVVVLVALGMALGLMRPGAAHACSCAGQLALLPADGSIGVPLNASITVVSSLALDIELREVDTDVVVPLTLTAHDGWSLATPTELLHPATRYRVTALREQVVDVLHGSFLTGDVIDATPVAFAGLRSLEARTMTYPIVRPDGDVCLDTCVLVVDGHLSRLTLAYDDLPADTALLVLTVYRQADHTLLGERVVPAATRELTELICGPAAPAVPLDEPVCARLTAFDIAHNRAGDDVEVCSTAQQCAPILLDNQCTPAPFCDLTAPPAPQANGTGCASTRSGSSAWLALVTFAFPFAGRRRQPR